MNINLAITALIILIILLLYQLKIWKGRALLSPAFYFSIIWILGIVGLLLFKSIGILMEPHPEYIDELNILVGFTGICFFLVTKVGIKKINPKAINIIFFNYFGLFKMISIFYFLLALYIFFTEGSGLDFGKARSIMHTTIENRSFLIGYFGLLAVPISIYAGSKIIRIMLKIETTNVFKTLFLILPIFSNTLFSLSEGGRVSMVYGVLFYIIGAGLNLPLDFNIKSKRKIILYSFFLILVVNIIITWVGTIRSIDDGTESKTEMIKDKLGVFAPLYGVMDYVYSSYVGYQYRRDDAVDAKLGYGQYTFNGFINWQLPFSSRFGYKDASIAKSLDIYYHNQETYDYSRKQYDMTHSAYLTMIKDFGFRGAFYIIIFLVYCSHYFFIKIQRKRNIRHSVKFFFYYLFLIYWAKSNFYGTLSESLLIPLYGFLIVDIINNIIRKK